MVKVKKQFSVIGLSAVLCFSSLSAAMAAPAPAQGSGQTASATNGSTGKASASAPDASVGAKISKDKAIEIAKQDVNIPSDYTLQNVNYNDYQGPYGNARSSWYLYFNKKSQGRFMSSISVSIDSNSGQLLNFSMYDNNPSQPAVYPPKVDFAKAKTIADGFIAKLQPVDASKLRYNKKTEDNFKMPLQGNVRYPIRYDRVVNGLVYENNDIMVTVNGEGEVVGYQFNWDKNVTFEDASNLISADKAKQIFDTQSKVTPEYIIPYQSQDHKPDIAYRMDTTVLDAKTGKFIKPDGSPADMGVAQSPVSDQPLKSLPSQDLNLTKEQAIQKVNALFPIPDQAKLTNASYNENTDSATGKQNSNWNLNWSIQGDNNAPSDSIWATVDSRTGEVRNFSHRPRILMDKKSGDTGSQKPKLSRADAQKIAADTVKKAAPEYANQLYLMSQPSVQPIPFKGVSVRQYTFNFERIIDGVNTNERINVNIDANSGDVVNYYNSISNRDYPAQKPMTITEDQARKLLLSEYDIVPSYIMDQSSATGGVSMAKYKLMMAAGEITPEQMKSQMAKAQRKAIPVYSLVPKYNANVYLDAVQGVWKKRDTGDVTTLQKQVATDIKGHWAEKPLQIMIDYGALKVQDGKVYPDKAITRGELIKMLVSAMNGGSDHVYYNMGEKASFADVSSGSPYYAYVQNAADRHLIDTNAKDFNPDAKVTRDDMAQLITRALGYGKLAEYTSIFNLKADDAEKIKNKGSAAILVGLGIMGLNNGDFDPGQDVTRAEAASAFYRFLQKRASLKEQGF